MKEALQKESMIVRLKEKNATRPPTRVVDASEAIWKETSSRTATWDITTAAWQKPMKPPTLVYTEPAKRSKVLNLVKKNNKQENLEILTYTRNEDGSSFQ